jgi:hypothetical protein
MSNTNTGGPAFPSGLIDLSTPEDAVHSLHNGMTLHDYFAAHADVSLYTPLENLTAQLHRKPTIGEMAEYIAGIRTIEAEAMLKAREA